MLKPDYIFEVSWEVCNKVGGINTVVSTKAKTLITDYQDNLILIGPNVWMETRENPDFNEDKNLFKSWREKAATEGLRIRVGRWNISGHPVVILVDFTPYFQEKDVIFAEFWRKYQLDSISGQWDYVEPALFGYAAAKVIESYYNYYLSAFDKIVAQFHEWMTGAGVLYLKDRLPQVGTIFTTHATVLGRCIAGNNIPLYGDMARFNPETLAGDFGVKAKHSLEKISARECDAFTTVSDITNTECKYFLGKVADVVTLNGFEDSFVPAGDDYEIKKAAAREKIIEVAEALTKDDISDDALLVINSGRYEFKNKGIDLFIDALGKINRENTSVKDIIALITVPAGHSGPLKELADRINGIKDGPDPAGVYLTHNLFDPNTDPIMNRIKENNLLNRPEDKVKVIFAPCYLNGDDGIFNLHYYDLLIGFDVSVFPSYYEPWGYTPLESIAFHIPTITTSLAGFGRWVNSRFPNHDSGVNVMERDDTTDKKLVDMLAVSITDYAAFNPEEVKTFRQSAYNISQSALWSNLIENYMKAYDIALDKVSQRVELYIDKYYQEYQQPLKIERQKPVWKKILINHTLPEKLMPLQNLSKNIWWSWNYEAIELFEMIDPDLWIRFEKNPIPLLESLSVEKYSELEANPVFMDKLNKVNSCFTEYMEKTGSTDDKHIAYFSMEYGLHDSIKIFSGGLGILAGDYLKEASDSNKNITGVGLLYRYGYFKQSLTLSGEQLDESIPQKFTHLPLLPVRDDEGNWITISIAIPGRVVYAKAWRIDVGRVPLYLLDTDIEENQDIDRDITHKLYGGDNENRLKQELVLGVGGIRLLDKIGMVPDIFHINEGHAAFIGLERLRKYVQEDKLTFMQAVEVVRASSLFTTHTPVPAGHDMFTGDILRAYIPHYPERLNISWENFMNLGRFHPDAADEKFSMSVLAAKLSQEMNGVSRIHGRVSREMFTELFDGYFAEELYIDYVTNGVHFPTWVSKAWMELYDKVLDKNYITEQSEVEHWKKIHEAGNDKIWDIRNRLRKEMMDYIKVRLNDSLIARNENPRLILETIEKLDEKALTIGFARRFATYKRAHLLFTNLERLSAIVNNPQRPVQFIFAGKAHPADKAGQEYIKNIVDISKRPEFLGKILFVENYDMDLATKLVQGVDIWLNTPTRPLEASGTSGEKAIMNGVINFSVLDGWWAEGYVEGAGWALKEKRTYTNSKFQDELDTETIYNMLTDEIIPLYYKRDKDKIPNDWIGYIKNTISEIAPHFTMKRQIDDYYNKYYNKLYSRTSILANKNYEAAKKIAAWKMKVINGWDDIQVEEMNLPDPNTSSLSLGEVFIAEITLNMNGLCPADIGMEIIFGKKENDEVKSIYRKEELSVASSDRNHVTFRCEIPSKNAGVYDYSFRIYPKNELLPHRQDFPLIKWI